jgi:exodeoxyribonuclease-3
MRITTWNVNSLRVRLEHLLRFAREHQPDVLCLQELKLTDADFPGDALREAFPYQERWGQRAYNGVAILSKLPLTGCRRGWDEEARLLACEVAFEPNGPEDSRRNSAAPEPVEAARTAEFAARSGAGGGKHCLQVYSLYVPNGAPMGSERFRYKLEWLGKLRALLDTHPAQTPLVVVGDMNVAPGDLDVWDPFKCDEVLLCSTPERQALQQVLDWGLVDPFREQHPLESAFSWWDYQKLGFQRNHGLRIDHTFVSRALMPRVQRVVIHREVRKWEKPSDHAPVSLDLS